MLKTKSVHSRISTDDGLRILSARFRGRGLPKDRYDVWMANLGPSEELLRAFPQIGWRAFSRRYKAEMTGTGAASDEGIDARNRVIKNHGQKFTLRLIAELARRRNVTLLCHCAENELHCHRHLLRALIERAG